MAHQEPWIALYIIITQQDSIWHRYSATFLKLRPGKEYVVQENAREKEDSKQGAQYTNTDTQCYRVIRCSGIIIMNQDFALQLNQNVGQERGVRERT